MFFCTHFCKHFFTALLATCATISLLLFCAPQIDAPRALNPKKIVRVKKAPKLAQGNFSVIFDLNGVLFKMDKRKAVSHLGYLDMVRYTMAGNSVDDLEDKIFQMLHQLHGETKESQKVVNGLVPLHKNKPIPHTICEWLRGTITTESILAQIEPLITKLEKEGYFQNELEVSIVRKIVKLMFDPAIRAQIYVPLKKGISLLKQCAQTANVYLLSNMDSELIALLQEQHPDIFELFDGIIVSADIHMIKPNKDIYEYTIKTYGLDPKKCCFIDDQKENVLGAENSGLPALLFSDKTTKKIRKHLIGLGLSETKTTAMA